jgi:hypothetical protein
MKKKPTDLVSWNGWDLRTGARAIPDAMDLFERASPFSNAESRYELLAVASRGFRPPQALSTKVVSGGGEDHLDTDEFPGLRLVWSVEYRQIAETAGATQRPYAIYLLGVNPPNNAGDDELEVFNDFYTNVHLVEVAERRHALRAARYELVKIDKAPYQGAPRYLAVYEVDETSASHRRHEGPPYSAGPAVWQRHSTPWRLWYRCIGSKA